MLLCPRPACLGISGDQRSALGTEIKVVNLEQSTCVRVLQLAGQTAAELHVALSVVCVVLWWERRLSGELKCEVRAEHRADASVLLSEQFFHGQCSWHGRTCVCI